MNDHIRRKKILFYYIRGATAGGSDTCLFLLLKYLNQSKYEPYLLYRDNSIIVEQLRDLGINIIQIPEKIRVRLHSQLVKNAKDISQPLNRTSIFRPLVKKSGNFGLFLSNLKHTIKKIPEAVQYAIILLKNRIDIVHTNHDINGDHSMILAAIFLRKKIVSHNRGLYVPSLISAYFSKYIDKIVCMSDFSKSVYVNNGVSEEICKTIYDGIDIMRFNPLAKESEKIIIGCIGRIEKWKGQQVLVEAAEIIVRKMPEIKFLLVGDGDNENEIRIQVKNKHLEKYFEFTGHVTNVIDYMNRSTIIVHTSIEPEPFGMVIIEAMALEKPVIATSIGGPLEIIDNEKDGFLIPAQNPHVLAEYIMRLAKDSVLRKHIGKKAREKVIAKFDVTVYARQIESVYDEISK